jgi:hypothetical protein
MLSVWRQGSVVTPKDVAKVLQANVDHAPEPAVDCEADRLLVISQDCDLTHHALKDEPWAEFLPIRRLDDYDKVRDNPCRYGKNPRRLVFAEMEGVREVWYWTEPHSRFRVPRMDAASQVEQELTQILGGCPGIDIDDIRIDPEEDLTLADLRHYQRMDLDYRSGFDRPMAAGPADEHP